MSRGARGQDLLRHVERPPHQLCLALHRVPARAYDTEEAAGLTGWKAPGHWLFHILASRCVLRRARALPKASDSSCSPSPVSQRNIPSCHRPYCAASCCWRGMSLPSGQQGLTSSPRSGKAADVAQVWLAAGGSCPAIPPPPTEAPQIRDPGGMLHMWR